MMAHSWVMRCFYYGLLQKIHSVHFRGWTGGLPVRAGYGWRNAGMTDVAMWRCGDAVVRWCGGAVVRWCGRRRFRQVPCAGR